MKVLIVDVSSRALAQSAAAAGFDVISLDYFGDCDQPAAAEVYALGRDLHRPLALSELARAARELETRAEAVVVGAGLENEPALAGLSLHGRRWFNSVAAVRGVRDLRRVASALQGLPLEVPAVILPGEDLPHEGRWLVKDLRRSGGMGIRLWDGKGRLHAGQVLQQFVEGELASATFAADGQRALLLGISRQYAGVAELHAAPFAWCGNAVPLVNERLQHILQQAAGRLAQSCGLAGLNGMDLILRGGVPFLLEVNPRPGGSSELFERLLGVNIFTLHVEACEGRLPGFLLPFPSHTAWGKGILYAPRDLRLGDTRAWAENGICDIPHPGELIPAGAPVCSLLAQGADLDGCWQNVVARGKKLL